MKYCYQCGASITLTAFCPACGAARRPPEGELDAAKTAALTPDAAVPEVLTAEKQRQGLLSGPKAWVAIGLALLVLLAGGRAVAFSGHGHTAKDVSVSGAVTPTPSDSSPSPTPSASDGPTPTPTPTPTQAAVVAPVASAIQTCDQARDPETKGLPPKDAALGLYAAWHRDSRTEAEQCAAPETVTRLFSMPLVTAGRPLCAPVSGSPSALTTDCTFMSTAPRGTLVMHESCDDLGCTVSDVTFTRSASVKVEGCDTRHDSHGRLGPEQIAAGVHESWIGRDDKALASCTDGGTYKEIKAHTPVRLTTTGCADTGKSDGMGFGITECAFTHGQMARYLVLQIGCGASFGCQLDAVKFDPTAT